MTILVFYYLLLYFQRRVATYENSVLSFLTYFNNTERLVTVDVTCGRSDFIWQHVHELLCEFKFQPCRCSNSVILFAFGKYSQCPLYTVVYDGRFLVYVYLRMHTCKHVCKHTCTNALSTYGMLWNTGSLEYLINKNVITSWSTFWNM